MEKSTLNNKDLISFGENIKNKNISDNMPPQQFGIYIVEYCLFLWKNGQNISIKVSKDNIWYVFERSIWEFGESLRLLFKENKKLGKDKDVKEAIVEVAKEQKYAKGRQTFVLLIGILKIKEGIPLIVKLLDDKNVRIHAIDSIIKMKITGLNNKMGEIYQTTTGGTRGEAKKYLERNAKWNSE